MLHIYIYDISRPRVKKVLAVERKVITANIVDETETRSSRKIVFSSLNLYVHRTGRNGAVLISSNF